MTALNFDVDSLTLDEPCGLSLGNSTGDWLGIVYDETEEPHTDDDPRARIYSEYYDQGNGDWGGIQACTVTGHRFVLALAGRRSTVLTLDLRLSDEEIAALRERLRLIFREAPDRLQMDATKTR
jgi:hypothetical protein